MTPHQWRDLTAPGLVTVLAVSAGLGLAEEGGLKITCSTCKTTSLQHHTFFTVL